MKKTNKNTTLTPEQYIRQKARTLPFGQCYMNKNWFISGIAIAVVCRCHKQGTYTFGVFQLDTFCTGLIECKIEFSRDKESYDNIMNYLKNSFKIEPVTYQEVHNLIYGAVAWGEDAGFTPPTIYNLAKYLMEEDTEDVPLINYQYGRFGKHFLLADSEQELDEFMPHLIAHLGKENVLFGIDGSDRYFRGEDFYDSKTREAMRQIAMKIRHQQETPIEEYSYAHPAYPSELNVKHEEVKDMLYNPANRLALSEEQLDQLLALPHEELRDDLQQILLYETGKTCDAVPPFNPETKDSVLIHCLILLGELGYPESLPVVLESMRQNKAFYDYHLGIILNETYVPTLYNLGKDQLDIFFEYLQNPGLYTYVRYLVFPTVVQIVEHEPARREEVIEWFRKVLQFYAANLENNYCCDGSLIGLLSNDLLKLKAEELLPELKVLYATGKVNEQCCGSYENVEAQMKDPKPFTIDYHFDARERYELLRNNLEQMIGAHNNLLVDIQQTETEEAQTPAATVVEEVEDAEVIEVKEAEVEEVKEEAVEEKPKKKTAAKSTATKSAKAKKADEKKPKTTRAKKETTATKTSGKATKATKAETKDADAKVKKTKTAKAKAADKE